AEIRPLNELVHGGNVTIVGEVIYPPTVTYYGRKRSRLQFNVNVDRVAVKAVMFNRTFAKKHLRKGTTVTLSGKWDAHRLQITVNHYQIGRPDQQVNIQPFYSVKGNLTIARLRGLIKRAISENANQVEELLPASYLKQYKLPERKDAIKHMHQPENRLQ